MIKIGLELAQTLRPGPLRDWAYNAIDCLATREISDTLLPRMDEEMLRQYNTEMAVQMPAFKMGQRGIKIDTLARDEARRQVEKEIKGLEKEIAAMPEITDVWDLYEKETGLCKKSSRKDGKHSWAKGIEDGPERCCDACGKSRMKIKPFSANSPTQVAHLMYDIFKMNKQRNAKGEVTTDEDALGRLKNKYPKRANIFDAILKMKGLTKQLGWLKTRLTSDNRFPSTFAVGVAWTRRWTASSNSFGEGGNSQNVSERHRHVFVADTGKKLCYADLKQAESNVVAHLAGDEAYIEAHKGDTHTYVARLVWPELPWNGDIKKDKVIAESHFPDWDKTPGHNYRYQSKAVQHGSNLGLTAFGLAIQRHISVDAARTAQRKYFTAFPGIKDLQDWVRNKVHNQEPLINPLGERIRLFGRPWDEHTYKQGLSYLPQSTVVGIINMALWRLDQEMDLTGEIELLAQVHDALIHQFPEENEEYVMNRTLDFMTIPIPITDIRGKTRLAIIGTEAASGWNWGHHSDTNPKGVKEWHI